MRRLPRFGIQVLYRILPQDKLLPLNSRAWTLQESLMARRRLILTPLEMIWQCLGEHRCECVHDQSLILGPAGGRAQLLMFDAMRSMVFPTESVSARPESAWLYWLWKIMVMQYSARNVTDWRDRLVAIGGLAQAMLTALEGEPDSKSLEDGCIHREEMYDAGLWRGDIVGGLLWAARPASELIDGDTYAYAPLQRDEARVGHPVGGREGLGLRSLPRCITGGA
ncbi:hypothetical protein B0H67DRAFT_213003 [Lasiosphaeris hirsuta]|uniref:Uncharacterized protein n=1 Tax=Lasiosphaeris hirsuta TaxID=260670 RepID=A0AA40ASC9_9PEZI|nr:hypothetical protein B0H67DRAFT_213003 [Lasiosphaeris hirsuta]